jgi:transposase-like protein
VLQEALEHERAEVLGQNRDERQATPQGYRNVYEEGTVKTAAGVFRLQLSQVRGLREPYCSKRWAALGRTSDVVTRPIVEMYAGGMCQRDIERAVRDITDRLTHEYEAFRTRALSSYDIACLLMDTVYEPLRRWGSKTEVLCIWGISVDGRKVLLTLSTAHSESYDSCLEVLQDLVKRGLQTPVTITTEGALGLIQAMAAMWLRWLRIRCCFHKMQNLPPKVPPHGWPAVKALVADMQDAPTFEEGQWRRQHILAQYRDTFPGACWSWEDDVEDSLHHPKVPARQR